MTTHVIAVFDSLAKAEQASYALLSYVNRSDIRLLNDENARHKRQNDDIRFSLFCDAADQFAMSDAEKMGIVLLTVEVRNDSLYDPIVLTLQQHGAVDVRDEVLPY